MLGVVVGLACAVLPPAAGARTSQDIRGTWTGFGAGTNQIETINLCSGKVTGEGSGNGYTWPVTGTVTGDRAVLKLGPFREVDYTTTMTGTVSSDGGTITGTWDDTNGRKDQRFTATRNGGPPSTQPDGAECRGQGEPDPEPTGANCTDPQTKVVTCAEPDPIPGICGPTGTIFPACNLPTNLPVVCGPTGTIVVACQPRQSSVIACGGTGTILPQCNLPPARIPQVCGPSNTILPPCTGANNPVTVCGPSGTVLPQCSFTSQIRTSQIDFGALTASSPKPKPKVPTVDVKLSCPTPLAAKSVSAAQNKKGCDYTINIGDLKTYKEHTLAYHAADAGRTFEGRFSATSERSPEEQLEAGRVNAGVFVQRAGALMDRYFRNDYRLVEPPTAAATSAFLKNGSGPPPYTGPRELWVAADIDAQIDAWAKAFITSLEDYNGVLRRARRNRVSPGLGAGGSSTGRLASSKIRVPAGRTRTVRVKLPARARRQLSKLARKRSSVPLRIIVSIDAEPRPVVRVVDVAMRLKPRRR